MKQTHYLTTKVQKGHRVELTLPDLTEGETVEVILIVPQKQTSINNISSESLNMKQNIMKKSLHERRKLLAEQAEMMQKHYEQDDSWQEWTNMDIGELYEY